MATNIRRRPRGLMHRLFLEHPRSLGMSWAQHGVGAVEDRLELIGAGVACLVHAVVPGWFTQTAGRRSTRIYDHMQRARPAPPIRRTGPIMKSDRVVPVAIIGGGFSGTILAAQLARRGIGYVLIDGSGRMGRGVAYSTTEPAHLLNVRAEGMSAWAGEPDDFAKSVRSEGGDAAALPSAGCLARYLGEILEEGLASGQDRDCASTAPPARRDGRRLACRLDNGEIDRGRRARAGSRQSGA